MKRILLLLLAAFPVVAAQAQFRVGNTYQDLYDSETMTAMKGHVRELASASYEGRKAGSEGEGAAADYVRNVFLDYGIDVLSPAGGETFGVKTEKGDTLVSRNVVGVVQGYDSVLRNQYVVVGARLDNMGTMTMTIDGKPVERIYYGANGNASGLAVLMELARMIQTNSILFRRSVILVAFGASSHSFAGSWYFLNRSFKDADKIDAMVNLDMLGTGYNGFYAYTSSNADMNALLRMQEGELQPLLPKLTTEEPYPSDHRAFYAREIPSVFFTTGRYSQHNTDKDTFDIIDFDLMEKELEYIFNVTLALANTGSPMAFRPTSTGAGAEHSSDVIPYFECDQSPVFFGSTDPRHFLREWVYQYLKYPASAIARGIQGTVTVEFIIEKDGKVSEVKVLRGVDDELDAEAVKVVSASPKWKAGKLDGEKVRASVSLPIEFRLEKKSNKPDFGIKK